MASNYVWCTKEEIVKSNIVPLIAGVIVAVLILGGCAQATPTTPTEPTTPTTPTEPTTPTTPTETSAPVEGVSSQCDPTKLKARVSEPLPGQDSWVGSYDAATWTHRTKHWGEEVGIPGAEPEDIWDGFALKPDGTPYHFVFSVVTWDMPWCSFSKFVAENYAKRAGAIIDLFDAQGSPETERANIEDAITKAEGNVDAIWLLPVDSISAVPMVENLRDRGYPTFIWGTEVYGPATVSGCYHDYVVLGRTAAEGIAAYAEQKGEVITLYEIWGMYAHSDAQERHQGLHEVLDPHPLVEVIESGECWFTDSYAMEAVIDTFGTHSEWDAIYEMANMTGGILSGLEAVDRLHPIGHPEHVYIYATSGPIRGIDGLRDEYIDEIVEQSPWEEMDGCIKASYHYVVLGQDVERLYYARTYNLTLEDCNNPLQWGCALKTDRPIMELEVMAQPDVIVTPTLEMRKELCGY